MLSSCLGHRNYGPDSSIDIFIKKGIMGKISTMCANFVHNRELRWAHLRWHSHAELVRRNAPKQVTRDSHKKRSYGMTAQSLERSHFGYKSDDIKININLNAYYYTLSPLIKDSLRGGV